MAEDNLKSLPIPDFSYPHWKEYKKQPRTKVSREKVVTAPIASRSSGMTDSVSSKSISNCTVKKLVSKVRDNVLKCKNLIKESTPMPEKLSLEDKLADMYLKDPPLDENKMKNKNFVTCDFLEKLVYELNLSYLYLQMYPKGMLISIRKPDVHGSIGKCVGYHKGEKKYQEFLNSVANKEIPPDLFRSFGNLHDVLLPDYYVILKTEEFTPTTFEPNCYTFNLLKPVSSDINALLLETVRRENIKRKKISKRIIEPKLYVNMSGPLYLEVDEASTLDLINFFSCHKVSLETKSTSLKKVSSRNPSANQLNETEIIQEWIVRPFKHISSSSEEVNLVEFLNLNGQSFLSKNNVENPFKSRLVLRNINEGYNIDSDRTFNMKLVEVFFFNSLIMEDNVSNEEEHMQYILLIFFKNGLFYIYCTEKTEDFVHINDLDYSNINMVRVGNRSSLDQYIFNFAQLISERFHRHLTIEHQCNLENYAKEKEIFSTKKLFSTIDKHMTNDTDEINIDSIAQFIPGFSPVSSPSSSDVEEDTVLEQNIYLGLEHFSIDEETIQSSEYIPSHEVHTTLTQLLTAIEDMLAQNGDLTYEMETDSLAESIPDVTELYNFVKDNESVEEDKEVHQENIFLDNNVLSKLWRSDVEIDNENGEEGNENSEKDNENDEEGNENVEEENEDVEEDNAVLQETTYLDNIVLLKLSSSDVEEDNEGDNEVLQENICLDNTVLSKVSSSNVEEGNKNVEEDINLDNTVLLKPSSSNVEDENEVLQENICLGNTVLSKPSTSKCEEDNEVLQENIYLSNTDLSKPSSSNFKEGNEVLQETISWASTLLSKPGTSKFDDDEVHLETICLGNTFLSKPSTSELEEDEEIIQENIYLAYFPSDVEATQSSEPNDVPTIPGWYKFTIVDVEDGSNEEFTSDKNEFEYMDYESEEINYESDVSLDEAYLLKNDPNILTLNFSEDYFSSVEEATKSIPPNDVPTTSGIKCNVDDIEDVPPNNVPTTSGIKCNVDDIEDVPPNDVPTTSGIKCNVDDIEDISDDEIALDKTELENMDYEPKKHNPSDDVLRNKPSNLIGNLYKKDSSPGEEAMQSSDFILPNDIPTTSGVRCNVDGLEDVSDDEFNLDKNELGNLNYESVKLKPGFLENPYDQNNLIRNPFENEAESSEPFIYASSIVKYGSVKTVFEAHQFEEKESTTQIQLLKNDSEKDKIEVYRCLHKEFCYNPKALRRIPVSERSKKPKSSDVFSNSSGDVEFLKKGTLSKTPAPSMAKTAPEGHQKSKDINDPSLLYFDCNFGQKELESLNNHLKFVCNAFKPRSIRKGSTMPGLPVSSAK